MSDILPGRRNPGDRLTKLLSPGGAERMNNGTLPGGLAYVLSKALEGREIRKDESDYAAANQALTQGLTSSEGDFGAALQNLQGMEGNPYAGEIMQRLAVAQAEQKRRQAEQEAQWGREDQRYAQRSQTEQERWQQRFSAEQAGRQQMLAERQRYATPAEQPSSVREWEYFQGLAPEDQQRYLAMKRAMQVIDRGDSQDILDPNNPGQPMAQFPKGIAPERTIKDDRVITLPGVSGEALSGGQYPQTQMPEGAMPPQAPQQPQGAPGMVSAPAGPGQPQMPVNAPLAGSRGMPTGGPQIQELPPTQADAEKERQRQENRARAGSTVIQDLQRGLDIVQSNRLAVGAPSLVTQHIPESDAQALSGFVESALSNVGLDTLQAMREASPTGGALGQVPIQQQKRLEQVLGSLDISQRPEVVEDNLKRVINIYMDIVYGAPEEVMETARRGEISQEDARRYAQRYQLSFDDLGRSSGSSIPADGGRAGASQTAADAEPVVTTQEQFDSLPSGAMYREEPGGQLFRKP